MTNDDALSDLLHGAAEASPQTDLVPAAVHRAKRRRVTQGVLAVAVAVPALALAGSLMVQPSAPTIQAMAPLGPGSGTSSPTSEPTTSPTSEPTQSPKSTATSLTIPKSLALKSSEIPKGIQLDDPKGLVSKNITPADGLMCDPGTPGAAEPLAGRWWSYANYAAKTDGESLKSPSLSLIVTRWKDGAVALSEMTHNKGYCVAFSLDVKRSSANSLSAIMNDGTALEVRRLNNTLVAVSYSPPEGRSLTASVTAQARRLADKAAARAEAAGLGN